MNESMKGKLTIALVVAVIMAIIVYATIIDNTAATAVATIVGGIIAGFGAWKDMNVSTRNIYFQNVLKPLVKKHGLEVLMEAIEGLDEVQEEDPEDDEELPQ